MDVSEHLRRSGRRVVAPLDDRPKGLDALRSLSYSYRRDKAWQATSRRHAARKAILDERLAEIRAGDSGFARRFRETEMAPF